MSDKPLVAHSLAEVYLHLMVTPCPNCGRGPLRGADATPCREDDDSQVAVEAACRSCKHDFRLEFRVPPGELAAAADAARYGMARVNPAEEPSRIIDVPGWVTLFRIITEAAAKTEDKIEARLLGFEAAQCLEEALKFYDEEAEQAPESAFFTQASRDRYRDNPQLLTRSRLIDLRSKLPTLDAMEKRLRGTKRPHKPWWKLWK